MKSKIFKKKLALNKKTVADFKLTEMRGIHGGINKPPVSLLRYPCVSDGCGTVTGDPCIAC